jgi:hypothetical protein
VVITGTLFNYVFFFSTDSVFSFRLFSVDSAIKLSLMNPRSSFFLSVVILVWVRSFPSCVVATGFACNRSMTSGLISAPFVVPPPPLNCDFFDPNCTNTMPKDYYKLENTIQRSRDYVAKHSPFLQQDTDGADAVNPRQTNIFRLRRLFNLVQHCSEPLTVTVLGGSLTAGRYVGGYTGAWGGRLERKLQMYRNQTCAGMTTYNHTVEVVNRAVSGTMTSWAVHQLDHIMMTPSNLVIVDYDVNDCLIVKPTDNYIPEMQGITELIVRKTLMELQPHAAMVFLNVPVNHHSDMPLFGECSMYSTCYSMDHMRRPVLTEYGVPQISFKAAWTNFSCAPPPSIWPCSNVCSHPFAAAHELLADLMNDFVVNGTLYINNSLPAVAASETCDIRHSVPLLAATNEMGNMICSHSVTVIDSRLSHQLYRHSEADRRGSQVHFRHSGVNKHVVDKTLVYRDGCWKYGEDVAGKPGWIGIGCINGSIIFNVKFGVNPVLNIVALTTYPVETGMVEISLRKLNITEETFPGPVNSTQLSEGFTALGQFNLRRKDGPQEFQKFSLSTSLSFSSHLPQKYLHFFGLWVNAKVVKKFRSLNLTQSNALVRITQISNGYEGPHHQKVKIISLQTC